ncbi:hypothetical protein PthBH41_02480 [Parageobacillus thermoglucosidasius]|nr:hypothetical protein PthBH41_02480 [Parageobacillus thermoglucosidasius]
MRPHDRRQELFCWIDKKVKKIAKKCRDLCKETAPKHVTFIDESAFKHKGGGKREEKKIMVVVSISGWSRAVWL